MDIFLKRLALIAGLGQATFGCTKDACEQEPPSFQLEVTGDFQAVTTLRVELSGALGNLRRDFELQDSAADGTTSLAVELVPAPEEPAQLTIALKGLDAQRAPVSSAVRAVTVEPNGCNRIEMSLSRDVDAGPVDAGIEDQGPIDQGAEDQGVEDQGVDAGVDAGMDLDAGPEDQGMDAGGCVETVDPDTIALYTFPDDAADRTGNHDGELEGNAGFAEGPPGCGQAFEMPNSVAVSGYLRIPHAPEFELSSGSIDFWIRAQARIRATGIISKDDNEVDGGLTLFVNCGGYLVARMQNEGEAFYRCSEQPLPDDDWAHVGLNFGAGGLELYVDGERVRGEQSLGLFGIGCTQDVQCDTDTTAGLQNNTQPWVIGVSSHQGDPSLPFRDGRIDSFRISGVPRAF